MHIDTAVYYWLKLPAHNNVFDCGEFMTGFDRCSYGSIEREGGSYRELGSPVVPWQVAFGPPPANSR